MKATSKIALIKALLMGMIPEKEGNVAMIHNEQQDEEIIKPIVKSQSERRGKVVYYTDEKGNIRRKKQ